MNGNSIELKKDFDSFAIIMIIKRRFKVMTDVRFPVSFYFDLNIFELVSEFVFQMIQRDPSCPNHFLEQPSLTIKHNHFNILLFEIELVIIIV